MATCDSSYAWNDSTYTQSGTYSYSGSSASNNYSMSFDGVDDYVDLGNSNDFDFSNSPLSIMCWVNVNNNSWIDGILSKNTSSKISFDVSEIDCR